MHLSCSDFPVLNNKACIEAGANEATKCKQEPLCEGAAGDSDEDCSKYIVQIGKEDSLICLFDQNKKKCFEQYFCESVPNPTDGTKINCKIYPVK